MKRQNSFKLYSCRSIILYMERQIYHGSEHIVKKPEFGFGNAYNDFGLGFYCSENARSAAGWAVRRDRNGFVSSYSINTDRLRIIDLCSSRYTPLHWLAVLFNFREFDLSTATARRAGEYISKNFSVDFQGTDCIIGYRADDICFTIAQDFIDGSLSFQSMRDYLKSDVSARQFVLKSNRAFESISFTGYEPAMSGAYYAEDYMKEIGSLRSMKRYNNENDLFIDRMIDEDIKAYDTRL